MKQRHKLTILDEWFKENFNMNLYIIQPEQTGGLAVDDKFIGLCFKNFQ